jgi:fructose-specific phosphotransferase system IIC component
MNTLHTSTQSHAARFDWAGQIKLAIVLSVVAAIAAISLAGRVAEPVLIVGVIVVASFAGWTRVQPARQPIRIPVRHR